MNPVSAALYIIFFFFLVYDHSLFTGISWHCTLPRDVQRQYSTFGPFKRSHVDPLVLTADESVSTHISDTHTHTHKSTHNHCGQTPAWPNKMTETFFSTSEIQPHRSHDKRFFSLRWKKTFWMEDRVGLWVSIDLCWLNEFFFSFISALYCLLQASAVQCVNVFSAEFCTQTPWTYVQNISRAHGVE